MGHRELDPAGADPFCPRLRLPGKRDARLRTAGDLDLAPGEAHAGAERLADGLLAGEARRIVLGRVGPAVAVLALGVCEAALAETGVALERLRDPLDLDQVDANLHLRSSSQSGSAAIESITPSGLTVASSRTSSRNFPVRTSTLRSPNAVAPPTSASTSSPTIQVCSGSYSSASSAAAKYAALGLPSTVASVSAAYSSPATNAPASSSAPREVCHQRFLCRQ